MSSIDSVAPAQTGFPQSPAQTFADDVSLEPGKIPDTGKMSEQERYTLYSNYINQFGDDKAKQDLRDGKTVVLALRHETPMDANGGRGAFDDVMVVVNGNNTGAGTVQEFKRTNAGEPTSESRYHYDDASTGGDSDGDGDFDPERLAGGSYRFKFDGNDGDAPGLDAWPGNDERSGVFGDLVRDNGYRLVPRDSDRVQVNDDYDEGSRSFDSSDPIVNGSNDTFAIHPGGRKGKDGAPDDPENVVSAGCLTVHPDDWSRFDASLPLDEFSLVLVNERDLNLPPEQRV